MYKVSFLDWCGMISNDFDVYQLGSYDLIPARAVVAGQFPLVPVDVNLPPEVE